MARSPKLQSIRQLFFVTTRNNCQNLSLWNVAIQKELLFSMTVVSHVARSTRLTPGVCSQVLPELRVVCANPLKPKECSRNVMQGPPPRKRRPNSDIKPQSLVPYPHPPFSRLLCHPGSNNTSCTTVKMENIAFLDTLVDGGYWLLKNWTIHPLEPARHLLIISCSERQVKAKSKRSSRTRSANN